MLYFLNFRQNMNEQNKHIFVLVHGAWHGAWCWEKVVPLLTAAGHAVHSPDLPGLGEDNTPIAEIGLDSYVQRVSELINGIGRPVVLVGHSMGGVVITQTAELIPDRIDTLIYLTAFSPKHGETLLQYSLEDTESLVSQHKQIDEDEGILTITNTALRECFYDLCAEDDAQQAIQRLRPQALAPLAAPLRLSQAKYGRVRRCYIECSADRAISPTLQRRMKNNAALAASSVLDADHSPFYSCPQALVEILIDMADKV